MFQHRAGHMVFAQQMFVLFNYWWKYSIFGLGMSIGGPEARVMLTYLVQSGYGEFKKCLSDCHCSQE